MCRPCDALGRDDEENVVFTGGASVIIPANTALIGDSLTDGTTPYSFSPFYWMNGILSGGLKVVANAGKSGHKVQDLIDRVDNLYTANPAGLAGLGTLGYVIVRIGTNDAAANTAIAGTLTTAYATLMAKLATYASRVIVLSVPPLLDSGQNALTQDYNTYLSANYNSGQFKYVDDTANLRDGSGGQNTDYFIDFAHFRGNGVYQAGVDGAAALSSYIGSYASPLVSDAADVYPATSQWITNPLMSGTSGTKGTGISGTVVDGFDVSRSGGSVAATCSVVTDSLGDVPWQRIAPTQSTASERIKVTTTLSGRSISNVDPSSLEVCLQVRFNNFDPGPPYPGLVDRIEIYVTGNSDGERMSEAMFQMLLQSPVINRTVTFRNAVPRWSTAAAQSGAKFNFDIVFPSVGFGPAANVGSVDFRKVSVRG